VDARKCRLARVLTELRGGSTLGQSARSISAQTMRPKVVAIAVRGVSGRRRWSKLRGWLRSPTSARHQGTM
jgi:hypothetical protein